MDGESGVWVSTEGQAGDPRRLVFKTQVEADHVIDRDQAARWDLYSLLKSPNSLSQSAKKYTCWN